MISSFACLCYFRALLMITLNNVKLLISDKPQVPGQSPALAYVWTRNSSVRGQNIPFSFGQFLMAVTHYILGDFPVTNLLTIYTRSKLYIHTEILVVLYMSHKFFADGDNI